jgi:hypothetical protein
MKQEWEDEGLLALSKNLEAHYVLPGIHRRLLS